MTNTRGASLYSGRFMTWPIRSMNGVMPVAAGVAANTVPVLTSRAASRARAPWRTYSCSIRTGLLRGRDGGTAAAAGLDGRLGVDGEDPVARLEPRALVVPLVQVHDHRRLGFEV